MSLMKAHKARCEKQTTADQPEAPETVATVDATKTAAPLGKLGWQSKHVMYQDALEIALADLKKLKAIGDKVELKRTRLVPEFLQYAEQYREAEQAFPNRPLVYLVVWLFDIGDMERAIDWALFAIDNGQSAPDEFSRDDLPTVVADAVLAWAEKEHKAGHSVQPYFGMVLEKVAKEWKLFEKITASYFKLAGLMSQDAAQDDAGRKTALEWFEKAEAVYPQIGVGTRIKTLKKKLNS